jgi:hypothetical protein
MIFVLAVREKNTKSAVGNSSLFYLFGCAFYEEIFVCFCLYASCAYVCRV